MDFGSAVDMLVVEDREMTEYCGHPADHTHTSSGSS
jgi:hypothetical protein